MNSPGSITSYQTYIFDLDNTLYAETDYLFVAYEAIAKYLAQKRPEIKAEAMAEFLKTGFVHHGRQGLFDGLLDKFKIKGIELADLLEILRTVSIDPNLELYPLMAASLDQLNEKGKDIFVVTNGNTIQQRNKVDHLEWNNRLDFIEVVYAQEHEPKPSPAAFHWLNKNRRVITDDTIMIGDQKTDEQFAANAQIDFIYINEFLQLARAELGITEFP